MSQVEDKLISEVLEISLEPSENTSLHVLTSLAKDLREETKTAGQLFLSKEIIDRVLVARLFDEPPLHTPFTPFQYLLGCYSRLYKAKSNLQGHQTPNNTLQETLVELRNLLLSYTGLVFTPGVIPQPGDPEAVGLQLLESIQAINSPTEGVVPLPSLFLEEFSASQDPSTLQTMLQPITIELHRQLKQLTLAGEYFRPLDVFRVLIQVPKLSSVVMSLQQVVGGQENGRRLESSTLLGALFSLSALPDRFDQKHPNIGEEFFADYETSSNRDRYQSLLSLRKTSSQYGDDLHSIVRTLLRKETRKEMLGWMVKVLESNGGRGQMNPTYRQLSSNGFFLNLCSVLLQLCDPFVDPSLNKAWPHLDPDYLLLNQNLDFSEDTCLAMSAAEVEKLKEEAKERQKVNYHFICECFFMTLKALHLGNVKVITSSQHMAREVRRLQTEIEDLEASVNREENPVQRTRNELLLKRYKTVLAEVQREQICIEASLFDPECLTKMNTFYRLVIAWMSRLTNIQTSANFQIPLPDPPPAVFASLPEYFLEDMVDVLICTGRMAPQVLESVNLEETVIFLMAMMGSPQYVKNPYLRGKLVDVLHICLPETLKEHPLYHRRSDILAFVFEKHPVILQHLVPSLLQLYVDIEFTGRHTQFYDKFQMRSAVSQVLEYVWKIEEHKRAWKLVANKEEGKGLYLHFCNMLVNDSIFLLDESLKELKDIKEIETTMANVEEWNAMPQEERQEHERNLRQHGAHLRGSFYQAKGYIQFLKYVTKETQNTFLLAEMVERVAAMLNYFLKYITGPERKKLKIKNPEQYDFDPKELLTGILEVYLHLDGADLNGSFSAAISQDGRSYRDEMFEEALVVVERMALMPPEKVEAIMKLSRKCKEAAFAAAKEDEILGDIPDEFLDPIQCTLMKDPVILPTSGHTLDRATITRHLLSDPKDPFNREPLSIDMLLPNPQLKQQIQEWLKAQKASSS